MLLGGRGEKKNSDCTDPFWTAPLTLTSTMSPTLKIRQILFQFIISIAGFRGFVPEGLEVGGHANHTMFLEGTAEGILSSNC
jgi:hypothetical protein